MPSINTYIDPLKPGRAQMPSFAVGDDPNWYLRFFNGNAAYSPLNVSMKLGFIAGLGNQSFPNAFTWVDRMNNQHLGSFAIAAGVPSSLTWDEDPLAVKGGFGAWLLSGRTPPASHIRKVYVTNKGAGASAAPVLVFNGGTTGSAGKGATATAVLTSTAVSSVVVTNNGGGYTETPIIIVSGGGGSGCALRAVLTSGQVTSIVVTAGGTGYSTAPTVTIIDPEATATAAVGGSSAITGYSLINQGSGYTSAPTVTISGGGGSSAAATATLSQTSWPLTLLSITNAGSGYASAPTVGFSGGAGSGAAATAVVSGYQQVAGVTVNGSYLFYYTPLVSFTGGGGTGAAGYAVMSPDGFGRYRISSVIITNGGSGYTSAPTVVLTEGGAGDETAAANSTLTAVVGNGSITSLVLTSGGSGYTSAPTVTFTGGGGSSAAATAVLGTSVVSSLTFSNYGTGYTSVPTIAFSGGGGTGASAAATVDLGITGVTLTQKGFAYTSHPTISSIPDLGAVFEASGIETYSVPFVKSATPIAVGKAVTATPSSTGRKDSAGNLIYDDSLLIIRPRYLVEPTLVLQSDALTWKGTFTPVTSFITSLLEFQRGAVVDVEIFGDGRLLLLTKLWILRA